MVVFLAMAMLGAQAGPPPAPATGAQDSRFRRLDRDGNGFVTLNEAPRVSVTRGAGDAPATGGAAWVAIYDRDGDGKVSAREYAAGPRGG